MCGYRLPNSGLLNRRFLKFFYHSTIQQSTILPLFPSQSFDRCNWATPASKLKYFFGIIFILTCGMKSLEMSNEIVNKVASIVTKETHTTTTTQVYTSDQLLNIGLRFKLTSNYNNFFLEQEVRSKIIKLEIRKHPRPYRRSRGRPTYFHKIATITGRRCHRPNWRTIDHTNLSALKSSMSTRNPNQVKPLNCALVNTRSCIRKTQDIQHLLTNRNLDICALIETWIKTRWQYLTNPTLSTKDIDVCLHQEQINRRGNCTSFSRKG